MSDEVMTTLRIVAFSGGGFVLVEVDPDGSQRIVRAVSTMDELVGAMQGRVRDWHAEALRVQAAHLADESPQVVRPRQWWRRIATG